MELSKIELRNLEINSCGPFVHSNYVIDGEEFSQEGPLKGRGTFLVDAALQRLELFPKDIKILDVGAYDGWVLNKLHTRGYTNLTGLEPRKSNIDRGIHVRSILGISDNVTHLQGTLDEVETLGLQDKYDFVTCFGVIHHVNDVCSFLSSVARTLKDRGFFLVETLTLDDSLVSTDIHDALEPKDIIYLNRPVETSIVGVKLESSYYPGSTSLSGTVQIPARRALIWFLEQAGFFVKEVADGWDKNNYHESFHDSHRRNATSTLIYAQKTKAIDETKDYTLQIEELFTFGILSDQVLTEIEAAVVCQSDAYNPQLSAKLKKVASTQTKAAALIVNSIIHDPVTKIRFERIKSVAFLKQKDQSIPMLIDFVTKLNSDWRSTYRALHILAMVDVENRDYWDAFALRCNPEFPVNMISNKPFIA